MRDTVRHPDARTGLGTTAEAARARLCAAARHGDPLAVEMAGRAYGATVIRALLIRFAHSVREFLRSEQRPMTRPRAAPARMADFEP